MKYVCECRNEFRVHHSKEEKNRIETCPICNRVAVPLHKASKELLMKIARGSAGASVLPNGGLLEYRNSDRSGGKIPVRKLGNW